jgi:hypothetical protein
MPVNRASVFSENFRLLSEHLGCISLKILGARPHLAGALHQVSYDSKTNEVIIHHGIKLVRGKEELCKEFGLSRKDGTFLHIAMASILAEAGAGMVEGFVAPASFDTWEAI